MKPEKPARLTQTDPRLCLTLEYNASTTRSWQSDPMRWSFRCLGCRTKTNPARFFMARGFHVSPPQTGKSKDRTLRAICNIREETGNVDKLHATREKTLHVQKYRTAEVTICMIPERTARSLPTISGCCVEDAVSLPKVSEVSYSGPSRHSH